VLRVQRPSKGLWDQEGTEKTILRVERKGETRHRKASALGQSDKLKDDGLYGPKKKKKEKKRIRIILQKCS